MVKGNKRRRDYSLREGRGVEKWVMGRGCAMEMCR